MDIWDKVKPCIKDYKIENMDIGDSLLIFFNKKEIKKAKAKKEAAEKQRVLPRSR